MVVVVDGKEGPECNSTSNPIFSPDSKHVAHSGWKGVGQFWSVIVLDGQEFGNYGPIANGPRFTPDGVLEFTSEKDNSLFRFKCIPGQ